MEREAFAEVLARYQDTVWRLALHMLGSPQDADDAAQEVFLRLYLEEKPFEGPDHLRRWLLRVTVNHCRDLLRSPWRRRRVSLADMPEVPVFDKPEQGALYETVLALPEKYRTVLGLFYYEDLPVKEIAELLGVGVTTVTTRLSRGRKLLAKELEGAWQDDEP